MRIILFCSALVWGSAGVSSAQSNQTTIHDFTGYPHGDGAYSIEKVGYGGLQTDGKGNLFGTTYYGGTSTVCAVVGPPVGCGTVFEISAPAAHGSPWTYTSLYSFAATTGVDDGIDPTGGLVVDSAGNLYGTTAGGTGSAERGTVFELSPPAAPGGAWTETLLYTFARLSGAADGFTPNGNLVMDAAGNLYGTTYLGGAYNGGTVFELSPPATPGGAWTETVLYSFGSRHDGPSSPKAGVVFNSSGDLIGATTAGAKGYGNVFELVPPATTGGAWTYRTIYAFQGLSDGGQPVGPIVIHGKAYYGASSAGVFELTSAGSTIIYDPEGLMQGIVADGAGTIYGTAPFAGNFGYGAVFQLVPPSTTGGTWTGTFLYSFTGGADGSEPGSGLAFGPGDSLFGITALNGDNSCTVEAGLIGCGTVFRVVR